MKKITLLLLALMISGITWSQCGPGPDGQFPGGTVTVDAGGEITNISTCNYSSEFSVVDGIVEGNDYEVSITLGGTDLYVTVENAADDSVISHGMSPFTFTAPAGVTSVHFNWSEDAACTYVDSGCRVTTVQDLTAAANACPDPTGFAASNLTDSTADLTWNEPGVSAVSYNVEVYLTGESAGGGNTAVFADAAVSGTSVMATGLAESTDYDAYITTSCSGTTATSMLVGPVTFTTTASCSDVSGIMVSNVTNTGADVSWTGGTGNDSALVEVYASGESAGNGDTAVYSNAAAVGGLDTASGLMGNTDYDVYVTGQCGATSTTEQGPISFTTDCDVLTAPYTEDFDTAMLPTCWSQGVSNGEDWLFTNAPGHGGNAGAIVDHTSGTGSFAWVDDSGSHNTGTTLQSPSVDVSGLTSPSLIFWINSNNEGFTNVDFSVDVYDGAVWNTAVYTSNTNTSDWQQVVIDLSTLTVTGPVQARFIVDENNGTDFYDDIALDDVSFEELPSCVTPSLLSATNVTANSADFSWMDNAGAALWNIELVDITAGGSQTMTATATGVTNPYAQMGLIENNDYAFYVQADCGAGGNSGWAGPFAFTTPCSAITPAYTADMSMNVPDSCWDEAGSGEVADGPMGLGASDWRQNRAYEDAGGTVVNSNAINLWQSVDREWLLSPAFDLSTGGPYQLEVNVAVTNYGFSGTTTAGDTMGSDDEVQLLMSTDDGATWTNLTTWNVGNQPSVNGTEYVEDLTAQTGVLQFAIWGSDGAVDDAEDYDFHVGKFRVREIPSCLDPSALMLADLTDSGVNFSWTENGTATMWDVELVDVTAGGSATGTPTTAATMDNPLAISGLVEQNDYELYVRAICGGDTSTWVGPIAFTTPCSIVSVDYVADMSLNVPDACWSEAGSGEVADGPMALGASDWRQGRGFTDLDGNPVDSNTLNLWQSVDREWLISPSFDLDALGDVGLLVTVAVTNYSFSGISDATDTDTMGSDDEVQLLMTNDNGATWTNITTWNVGNQPDVTGTNYVFDMTGMTGAVQFALFGSDGASDDTEDYDFHVGRFEVNNNVLSTPQLEGEVAFTYYPNPVKNTLTLSAQNTIENVTMYNMLGREVLRATPNAVDSDLDMSTLQTGTYFVKVTIANITQTIRVIKQ